MSGRQVLSIAIGASLMLSTFVMDSAGAGSPDPELERDLVALVNVDRTSNGLSALDDESRLTGLAGDRSDDMLTRNYFSHQIPPTGELVFAEMSRRRIQYEAAGENIGRNSSPRAGTVQFAERQFMSSSAHRANVLSHAFTRIGAGVVPGRDVTMFTVLFIKPAANDPTLQPPVSAAGRAATVPSADPSISVPGQAAVAPSAEATSAPSTQPPGALSTQPGSAAVPTGALPEAVDEELFPPGVLEESVIQEGTAFASLFEFVIDSTLGRSLGVPGRE